MLFGNRRPQVVDARRRDDIAFRPLAERLESKILLTIDLGGTSPPILPRIASGPFGIDMAGTTPNLGAGWSVADIADVTGTRGYDDILVGAPTVTSPSTLGTAGSGAVYLIFGSASVGT